MYYLITGIDTNIFNIYEVVKLITIFNHVYLVESLITQDKEYLMYYNLYPFIKHSGLHKYNKKYQKLIPSNYYLNKKTNEIEIFYNDIKPLTDDYIRVNEI